MNKSQSFQPTHKLDRLLVIDALRGFALLGLPFVNLIGLWVYSLRLSDTHTDLYIQRLMYILIEGRFFSIFSFLFGLGVWLFLTRLRAKGNPLSIYIRRMLALLCIGIIHQFLQPGEALFFYAILGFVLMFFYIFPKKVNLSLGLVGVILFTLIQAKLLVTLPAMILGIAAGQYAIFERIKVKKPYWVITFSLSFILSLIITVYLWKIAPPLGQTAYIEGFTLTDAQLNANEEFYRFSKIAFSFSPIYSLCYISSIVLLYAMTTTSLLKPLESFGRMAFSNYIGQTLLLLLVSSFMIKTDTVSYSFATVTCFIILLFQISFSHVWLKHYQFGPLEWLWRCITYKKFISIK